MLDCRRPCRTLLSSLACHRSSWQCLKLCRLAPAWPSDRELSLLARMWGELGVSGLESGGLLLPDSLSDGLLPSCSSGILALSTKCPSWDTAVAKMLAALVLAVLLVLYRGLSLCDQRVCPQVTGREAKISGAEGLSCIGSCVAILRPHVSGIVVGFTLEAVMMIGVAAAQKRSCWDAAKHDALNVEWSGGQVGTASLTACGPAEVRRNYHWPRHLIGCVPSLAELVRSDYRPPLGIN